MKKIQLLAFCFLFAITTKAQIFEWAGQIGGNFDDQGASVAVDALGNVYTIGTFTDTADFDPSVGIFKMVSFGVKDVFISKMDALGNFIWAKQIGGTSHDESFSIAIDKWNNVHVIGYFQGTIDLDPSPATQNITSAGSFDVFVVKLNSNGDLLWGKQFGGSIFDSGNSIALDTLGNVYLAGAFAGTADFDPSGATFNLTSAGSSDVYINKLDSLGNFVWAINMGGTAGDEALSITTDKQGNVYSTGYFRSIADFNPSTAAGDTTNLTSKGAEDIYVAKFDNTGALIWAKAIGSTAGDRAVTIAVDTALNVYFSGYYGASMDLDPDNGVYTTNPVGNDDAFIAKFDKTGAFVWGFGVGGNASDIGYSVKVTESGNVYCLGFFLNTADFDPSSATLLMNSGAGSVFILKLNSNGTLNWVRQMASPFDRGQCIAVDGNENLYITGYFEGIADFNPNPDVEFLISNVGNNSAFITKLSACINTTASITDTVCNSYTSPSGNYIWTSSGTYLDTLTNFNGCDSIITINLTIKNNSTSSQTISACNSYTSPSGNYIWTATGFYSDTLTNFVGCDSIITINLTIKNNSSSTQTISACNSYTSPSGNYIWTTSGSYLDTIPNLAGCDSVITTALTITVIDTAISYVAPSLIAATNVGANYYWIDCNTMLAINGATSQAYTAINNGSYASVITNNGCTDTTACYQLISLNTTTLHNKTLELYPNPTDGLFNLVLNKNYEKVEVTITNLLGSVVTKSTYYKTQNIELNIDAEKGVYLVQIDADNQQFTHFRVVKK